MPTGDAFFNDLFWQIILIQPGSDTLSDQTPADSTVHGGKTATIGFWQNKNGQNLIKSLPVVTNADGSVTSVANWLAATFVNMYGANAGANNLTGKSNTQVADFFIALFKRNGQTSPGGPPKVDAQVPVLATALAVYVTNQTLSGPTAASYGYQVTSTGVGATTFNVGSKGAAFGVADNSVLTVLDLLLATDSRTRRGLLYDLDGSGTINSQERSLREMANEVYTAINEQGDR